MLNISETLFLNDRQSGCQIEKLTEDRHVYIGRFPISIEQRKFTIDMKLYFHHKWIVIYCGTHLMPNSPGTPVSSTNKTDLHDITEILLNVALNIINQTKEDMYHVWSHDLLICAHNLKFCVRNFETCAQLLIFCALLIILRAQENCLQTETVLIGVIWKTQGFPFIQNYIQYTLVLSPPFGPISIFGDNFQLCPQY